MKAPAKSTKKLKSANIAKGVLGSSKKRVGIWAAIIVALVLIVGGAFFFRFSKASANFNRLVVLNTAIGEIGHQEWDARTLEYTGGAKDAWCAYFVSWVYKKAGYPLRPDNDGRVPLAWKPLGVNIKQLFVDKGAFYPAQKGTGYQASIGDVVVFGEERSHVGIVSEYSWTDKGFKLVAIEGNSNIQGSPDRVVQRTYTDPNVANIMGFGSADAFVTQSDGANKTSTTTAPAPAAPAAPASSGVGKS